MDEDAGVKKQASGALWILEEKDQQPGQAITDGAGTGIN